MTDYIATGSAYVEARTEMALLEGKQWVEDDRDADGTGV